jgi:hypothetical protein
MCVAYPEHADGGRCRRPGCTRRTAPPPEGRLRVLRGAD